MPLFLDLNRWKMKEECFLEENHKAVPPHRLETRGKGKSKSKGGGASQPTAYRDAPLTIEMWIWHLPAVEKE